MAALIIVTLGTLVGTLAAIYLNRYIRSRWRRWLKGAGE